ncbi:hypothetical protein HY496_01640 [Candidatus Woesearchaeota archaeon]|nr:hypothetical protein [Candidatus Woesearchaeota archaeon]
MNSRVYSIIQLSLSIVTPLLLLLAYFIFDNPILRLLSLALSVALFLLAFLYFPTKWSTSLRRFNSHLDRVQSLLFSEPLTTLKREYEQLYHHYESLSDDTKEKCYGPMLQIRGRIEELLQSMKKLETLASDEGYDTLEKQRQRYEDMNELYLKLPPKEQKHWAAHLRRVREVLEKGS